MRFLCLVAAAALAVVSGGDAPVYTKAEVLVKLNYFAATIKINKDNDGKAQDSLQELCKSWSSPSTKKLDELQLQVKADNEVFTAKKEATKGAALSLPKLRIQIAEQTKTNDALSGAMAPVLKARNIGRRMRENFIEAMKTASEQWDQTTLAMSAGLKAAEGAPASLLELDDGEDQQGLASQTLPHDVRFKAAAQRHVLRTQRTMAVPALVPALSGESMIGVIVQYSGALKKILKEAQEAALKHGANIKALVENSQDAKEKQLAAGEAKLAALQKQLTDASAQIQTARADEAQVVEDEGEVQKKVQEEQKQIAEEKAPCALFTAEFEKRAMHRQALTEKIATVIDNIEAMGAGKTGTAAAMKMQEEQKADEPAAATAAAAIAKEDAEDAEEAEDVVKAATEDVEGAKEAAEAVTEDTTA